jgi:hypothetical protein
MPIELIVTMAGDPGVITVDGLSIPDAGPVFLTALAVHVLAGGVCVVTGALAATARKRAGWHPRAGTVYVCGLLVLVITAAVMATARWEQDRHLLAIAVVTGGLGAAGWWARRRRPPGWLRWHGIGMSGSYIAVLTGFYVDNGPLLPLWDRLPHLAYWLLPAVIGVPLTWWALARNGALPGITRRPATARSGGSPRPRE